MRHRHGSVLVCALILPLLAAACSDDPLGPPGGNPSPEPVKQSRLTPGARAEIRAAVQGRKMRGIEDEILRIESRVPGFAGMHKDASGQMVVHLADLGQRPAAAAEMAKIAVLLKDMDPGTARDLAAGRIKVVQADYSFSQLVDWQQATLSALAARPGFNSVDADESTNHVHVTLLPGTDIASFSKAMTGLGIPAQAIEITYDSPMGPANIRNRFPNGLGGGMQIENELGQFCSLGFNVTTNYDEQAFVTAGHCAPGTPGDGVLGNLIYQNVNIGGYQVGTILENPVWPTIADAPCNGKRCPWADVMLVKYLNASLSVHVVAATTYLGQNNQLGSIFENAWRVNQQRRPYPLYAGYTGVDKVGRTTGWTRGNVSATCVAQDLGTYWVRCSNLITGSSAGEGDSGASVFLLGPTTTWVVGILFAAPRYQPNSDNQGNTWCNQSCVYAYSDWSAIESGAFLSRTLNP